MLERKDRSNINNFRDVGDSVQDLQGHLSYLDISIRLQVF